MKNYLMGTVFGALIVGLCVSVGLNCFLLSIVDEHVVLRAAPKDSPEPEPAASVPVSVYTASADAPQPTPLQGYPAPSYYAEQAVVASTPPAYQAIPVLPTGFTPPPMPYAPAPVQAPAQCQAVPCQEAGTTANCQAGQPCQATLTFSIGESGVQTTTIPVPFSQLVTTPACASERSNQVYVLRNTAATNVANALNALMSTHGQQTGFCQETDRQVVVVAEPITNKLLVSATAKGFREVERLILELDASPHVTAAVPTFAATFLKGCPATTCTVGAPCPNGACATAACPNTAACANAAPTSTAACPNTAACANAAPASAATCTTTGRSQATAACPHATVGCAQAATTFGLITGATFCPSSGCQAATVANLANLCPASTQKKTSEADLAAKLEKCLQRLAELEKKLSETQQPTVPYSYN